MFIDGAYRILYIDSGDGYLPVGCLTNHSFNEESDTIQTTTRDNNGWSTSRATNQNYNISFDGLVLEDHIDYSFQTYYNLRTIKRNRQLINWKIDETDYGQGIITSLSDENEMDANVSFTAELIGYSKPLIQLDVIYEEYVARSVANGSYATNDNCLKKFISDIIKN